MQQNVISLDDLPNTGTVATRNNNPLNMKLGGLTSQYVQAGQASPSEAATDGGRFLWFSSPETGFDAADKLIQSDLYSGLSVDQALRKWSNNGYGADKIAPELSEAKISDLNPSQRHDLLRAMATREGYSGPDSGNPSDVISLDKLPDVISLDQLSDSGGVGRPKPPAPKTAADIAREMSPAQYSDYLSSGLLLPIAQGIAGAPAGIASMGGHILQALNPFGGTTAPLQEDIKGMARGVVQGFPDIYHGITEGDPYLAAQGAGEIIGNTMPAVYGAAEGAMSLHDPSIKVGGTSPSSMTAANLMGRLGIDDLTSFQRAWDIAKRDIGIAERAKGGVARDLSGSRSVIHDALDSARNELRTIQDSPDAAPGQKSAIEARVAALEDIDQAWGEIIPAKGRFAQALRSGFGRVVARKLGEPSMSVGMSEPIRLLLRTQNDIIAKAFRQARDEVASFPNVAATANPLAGPPPDETYPPGYGQGQYRERAYNVTNQKQIGVGKSVAEQPSGPGQFASESNYIPPGQGSIRQQATVVQQPQAPQAAIRGTAGELGPAPFTETPYSGNAPPVGEGNIYTRPPLTANEKAGGGVLRSPKFFEAPLPSGAILQGRVPPQVRARLRVAAENVAIDTKTGRLYRFTARK